MQMGDAQMGAAQTGAPQIGDGRTRDGHRRRWMGGRKEELVKRGSWMRVVGGRSFWGGERGAWRGGGGATVDELRQIVRRR